MFTFNSFNSFSKLLFSTVLLTALAASCEMSEIPQPPEETKTSNFNLYLSNMNNFNEPQVLKGSYLYVNKKKFVLDRNCEIYPDNLILNEENFVYAENFNDTAVLFTFNTEIPVWDESKYGWYSPDGSKRAVAKFYLIQGDAVTEDGTALENVRQYNGKVLLTSPNSLDSFNTDQIIPQTGGIEVYNKSVKSSDTIYLKKGVYRYVLVGGSGGAGSRGGDGGWGSMAAGVVWIKKYNAGGAGAAGGGGAAGQIINSSFFWRGGEVSVYIGANGSKGNNGTNGKNGKSAINTAGGGGGGGGGGHGGAGENSSLNNIIAKGGAGGSGGNGGQGGQGLHQGGDKHGGAGGTPGNPGVPGGGSGGGGGDGGSHGWAGSARGIGYSPAGKCEIYFMW
jgi:hypothetical protein